MIRGSEGLALKAEKLLAFGRPLEAANFPKLSKPLLVNEL